MTKLIGLLAEKGHGKDTVAEYLVNNHDFTTTWFAKPIKLAAMHLFDFSHDQVFGTQEQKETVDERWGVSPREVLQVMGTEMFQYDVHKHMPNLKVPERKFWVELFHKWYVSNSRAHFPTVVADVRFQHEVDKIHELGGEVWKIVRPSKKSNDQHVSEQEINKIIDYDWLIENNSTLDELYQKVGTRLSNS